MIALIIAMTLLIAGCGPMAASVPKTPHVVTESNQCQVPSDKLSQFNSIADNDRSYDVQIKMQSVPTSEFVDGLLTTHIYVYCKQLVVYFNNDEVIAKEIK